MRSLSRCACCFPTYAVPRSGRCQHGSAGEISLPSLCSVPIQASSSVDRSGALRHKRALLTALSPRKQPRRSASPFLALPGFRCIVVGGTPVIRWHTASAVLGQLRSAPARGRLNSPARADQRECCRGLCSLPFLLAVNQHGMDSLSSNRSACAGSRIAYSEVHHCPRFVSPVVQSFPCTRSRPCGILARRSGWHSFPPAQDQLPCQPCGLTNQQQLLHRLGQRCDPHRSRMSNQSSSRTAARS